MESDRKGQQGAAVQSWGGGVRAHFRVGILESLSEKITFKLRSGRHDAADQEPRSEIGRDFCASRTQRMLLPGPRLRKPVGERRAEMRQER